MNTWVKDHDKLLVITVETVDQGANLFLRVRLRV